MFTAFGAVRHVADLRAGEHVGVVAAGGVGLNIMQIARAFGASQIVAVDVSEQKLEAARRLGAYSVFVLVYGTQQAGVSRHVVLQGVLLDPPSSSRPSHSSALCPIASAVVRCTCSALP